MASSVRSQGRASLTTKDARDVSAKSKAKKHTNDIDRVWPPESPSVPLLANKSHRTSSFPFLAHPQLNAKLAPTFSVTILVRRPALHRHKKARRHNQSNVICLVTINYWKPRVPYYIHQSQRIYRGAVWLVHMYTSRLSSCEPLRT